MDYRYLHYFKLYKFPCLCVLFQVPIIKFTDRETAVKVDVGFNVSTGAQSVQFIKVSLPQNFSAIYLGCNHHVPLKSGIW